MNKPKFNPIVTRVKLNPEQAVLACGCWNAARQSRAVPPNNRAIAASYCWNRATPRNTACRNTSGASASIS